jgi:hypothetical protein
LSLPEKQHHAEMELLAIKENNCSLNTKERLKYLTLSWSIGIHERKSIKLNAEEQQRPFTRARMHKQ